MQDDTKSAIAFLVNHMCFDGGDFGYLLGKFVECYNNYLRAGSCEDVEIKTGSRDGNKNRLRQSFNRYVQHRHRRPSKVKLDGLEMTDAFMNGATKYKPYVQVTFNVFAGGESCVLLKNALKKTKKSYRIFLTI